MYRWQKCAAYNQECFGCGRMGHFKGSKACHYRKKKNTSRVQDQEHTSSAEYATDSDLTDSDPEESSSDSEPQVNCTQGRRSKNHIAARRIGAVRKASNGRTVYKVSSKKYHVEVIVNEKEVPAFADTGADISVISHKVAKQLGLTLSNIKMKIKPYGSKSLRCIGFYVGPVMYDEAVANLRIYVVDKDLEFLLSGQPSEELSVITFKDRRKPLTTSALTRRTGLKANQNVAQIVTQHKRVFEGIGTT